MPTPQFVNHSRDVASTHLKWDVFVTPSIPVVTNDIAPGEHERPWPPISCTLIYGERDAVLVDSFITLEQARAQAEWIIAKGKNLTMIYTTHGHGDRFFGASVLLDRFPKARFVAAPGAIQVMKEQVSPDFVAKFWESRFPNQLPKRLVIAQELRTSVLELEGEDLSVVPLEFTDTAGTSCLHIPSRGLIVAGDAAYNGVHPRLVESEPLPSGFLENVVFLTKITPYKPTSHYQSTQTPINPVSGQLPVCRQSGRDLQVSPPD